MEELTDEFVDEMERAIKMYERFESKLTSVEKEGLERFRRCRDILRGQMINEQLKKGA